MQRQVNWIAALIGIFVCLLFGTVAPKLGIGWPWSSFGGVVLGVMVYFALEDYWPKQR
jgi:cytosine/uracil/thiamine/allantoin permease